MDAETHTYLWRIKEGKYCNGDQVVGRQRPVYHQTGGVCSMHV